MSDLFRDVLEFHEKFNLPGGDLAPPTFLDADAARFRVEFMREEVDEFVRAHDSGDLADAADALADLVYVALGTAVMMHLPFAPVWREVHRANMTKVRASNADDPRSTRGHALDVVKPAGFRAPDHRPALLKAALEASKENFTKDGPVPGDAAAWSYVTGPVDKWDVLLMGLADYWSRASKDPTTKVGAVVVAADDRRKIANGYNGFPPGVADTPERLSDRVLKNKLVQHAERNALDNATFDVRGGTLYTTRFPCADCAKSIISRRLARVVYHYDPQYEEKWAAEVALAKELLAEVGIRCEEVSIGA